ncbi:sex-determining protein fem-1 [Eurytemora carolleeae]|uniref:sex-determining protein fem-1 n=1 Tax=Eurytemora carolleeae TaxID=1294199 RepID=UPI000C76AC5B|nr:sex-determining protein fem-1 [Eurytemora carolleeae]|eukprot:XP_023337272.1 sex-determining protein fem-1-like [Eurytemora affinis]
MGRLSESVEISVSPILSVNSPYPLSPKPRTRAPLVLHTLTNQISAEPTPKSINHTEYRKSSSLLPEIRPIAKLRCCDLIRAIQLGDICTVRQYVRADKKNINSCWNGTTPLLTAIRVHNAEIVEVLLEYGADINQKLSRNGLSLEPPLVFCIRIGSDCVLQKLIQNKHIDLNIIYKDKSALEYGVEENKPLAVSRLISKGVCIPGGLLSSAIKRSGYINGQEIAFILIKAGARVQEIDKEGRTALHWAVYVGNIELVDTLLRQGSNPRDIGYSILNNTLPCIREKIVESRRTVFRLSDLARFQVVNLLGFDGTYSNNISKLDYPTSLISLN